jgi:hypothetical protein
MLWAVSLDWTTVVHSLLIVDMENVILLVGYTIFVREFSYEVITVALTGTIGFMFLVADDYSEPETQ